MRSRPGLHPASIENPAPFVSPPVDELERSNEPVETRPSWRDSRAAARAFLTDRPGRALLRLAGLVAVAAAGWGVWQAVAERLPPDQAAVLLLLVLAVGLWVSEAVPAFTVGMFVIGYLVFVLGTPLLLESPRDVTPYVNTWSSEVIWIMLGGFVLAEGMSRVGLDRVLLGRALRVAGTRPQRVLLVMMIATAVSSMFISNTSTTALMIGAVVPLVDDLGKDEPFGRALLVGIPLAASVGGMGTIIGSAPNAIAVGATEELGRGVDFLEWMLVGVPISMTLILLSWLFLSRRHPSALEAVRLSVDESAGEVDLRHRIIVTAVALVTVGLWITTPIHHIHAAAISLIPIIAFTMTEVVDSAGVRALPWDTLMLVAGGLSLGAAVVDTGLAARLASGLGGVSSIGSPLPAYFALATITILVSNVMSNTAAISIVLPVAVALMPGREIETALILGLSASCALLLPISTPPNAIAFASGRIGSRDFRPSGLLIAVLGPVVVIAWVSLLAAVLL